MKIEDIKFDCKYFQGHIPCLPNKLKDVSCLNCENYVAITKRILIIKLGAIGDVIRTTPLITKYRNLYPDCHITWLTLFSDVLPQDKIDNIYKLDAISLYKTIKEHFDIAVNLDKDKEACMILADVKAKEKFGFIWKNDHIYTATPKAEHKLITGLFDNISKKNTKNYLEEIFEMCHLEFKQEEYLINLNSELSTKWGKKLAEIAGNRKIAGLNTGCGKRWQTRLWPEEYWIELINELQQNNYFCILLGGEAEDRKNKFYAQNTHAFYPGYFSLEEFISLSDNCDIIVTQVSMMLHIAIALKKQIILFNNIFNHHEFELYNRGVILEPTSGCDCYYGNTCKREKSCMYDISVSRVMDSINDMRID